MTCILCQHGKAKKFGKYGKAKIQRYRCHSCRKTFSEPRQKPLGSHLTNIETTSRVVNLIMEGMSIRAVSRFTGLHKNTIMALLATVGANCSRVMEERMTGLRPSFVQADELWSYVHTKEKRRKATDPAEWGDNYVWVALDSQAKTIISYHVGKRDGANAYEFIEGLRKRTDGRFQITTDGLESYLPAIEEHYGCDVDFSQLVKIYGKPKTDGPDWYHPSHVIGTFRRRISGDPDEAKVSTSHVERINLSFRMALRRLSRLTNAFSKTLEGLKASLAIFVAWYNFCRVHSTLRVTPAMESGISAHVWTIRELIEAGATQGY